MYANTKEDKNEINKLLCVCVYCLIYFGYIKVLFPSISTILTMMQYMAAIISVLLIFRKGKVYNSILIRGKALFPVFFICT